MKTETARKKLNRVLVSSREYRRKLYRNPRDRQTEAHLARLKRYAMRLLHRPDLDVRQYKGALTEDEYREYILRQPITPSNQLNLFQ